MEQAIRAEVDRINNPNNSKSNKLNGRDQGRTPADNFAEARKGSKNEFDNWRNKLFRPMFHDLKGKCPYCDKVER